MAKKNSGSVFYVLLILAEVQYRVNIRTGVKSAYMQVQQSFSVFYCYS